MARLYDDRFFDWVDQTARMSADHLLPVVKRMCAPQSVVDVGCGRGTWLAAWRAQGVADVKGLDGDYVDRARLAIDVSQFEATDLTRPHTDDARYDLAQSLEVAEHLPPSAAAAIVDRMCALSDVVLFSAAQPGQGGEGHVNERYPSYWAELYKARGYHAFDCLRPLVSSERAISPWYRYNSIIYANAEGQKKLSAEALARRCDDLSLLDANPKNDIGWIVRKLVLRPLPVGAVTWLSRVHYSLVSRFAAPMPSRGTAA